jgi:hypothetical protein
MRYQCSQEQYQALDEEHVSPVGKPTRRACRKTLAVGLKTARREQTSRDANPKQKKKAKRKFAQHVTHNHPRDSIPTIQFRIFKLAEQVQRNFSFDRLAHRQPTQPVHSDKNNYHHQFKMGRLHSKGKGIASSAIPYSRTPAPWVKTTPDQVVEQICKLARKGASPSQIGVVLRDSHGIAQVKTVTGMSSHDKGGNWGLRKLTVR